MVIAAIFLSLLFQIADAVTTVGMLRLGGAELNPLVRWLISRFGMSAAMMVKVAAVFGILGSCYLTDFLDAAPWAAVAIAGMSCAVVINNLLVMVCLSRRNAVGRLSVLPHNVPAERHQRMSNH